MSLSVLDVLRNAEYNLVNGVMPIQIDLAIEQLKNAIKQLDKNPDANELYAEDTE